MEHRELRHDRHRVSLLTDQMIFSPKYRGKVLVGDDALFPWLRSGYGWQVVEKYIRNQEAPNAKTRVYRLYT